NLPAIRTLQAVGVKAASAWARKLGITTKINEDLSMALGSSCVTISDLTGVYATFNRLGRKAKMIYLRRVLDRDGRILEDHSSYYDPWTWEGDRIAAGYAKLFEVPEQVMNPETAFLMQQLMTEVCKPPGTAGGARRPARAGARMMWASRWRERPGRPTTCSTPGSSGTRAIWSPASGSATTRTSRRWTSTPPAATTRSRSGSTT